MYKQEKALPGKCKFSFASTGVHKGNKVVRNIISEHKPGFWWGWGFLFFNTVNKILKRGGK